MLWLRAITVWFVIIFAETIHGTLRTFFLAPYVGDLRARQISFFTGCALILAIAYLFIRWIEAETIKLLLVVGLIWVVLTALFEVMLGRFAMGFSWEQIIADYDITKGRLMMFGLVFLMFAPLIAAKMRGNEKEVPQLRLQA
jgi:hypothetical protein